jgi:hypothetical protein
LTPLGVALVTDTSSVVGSTVVPSDLPRRHPVDVFVIVLLVLSFFLGPVKLLGISWLSYLSADGLALLVLFVVFAERIANRKPVFASSPLSVPLILMAIFCVLEIANPVAPFIRSILGLRSWLLYMGFYFVGLYTLRSIEQIERLYAVLLTLGLLTAVYGIYQWQAGPESFATWSDYYGRYARLGWSAQSGSVFRAFSTFVAPGIFGGNMSLLMMLAFGVIVSPRFATQWRLLAAAAFLLMGVGIAASGSRGPVAHLLLAAMVGIALIPGVRRRLSVGIMAVVMTGISVGLIAFLIGTVVSERFSTIFDPQAFFWKWFGPLSNGIRVAGNHFFGMGLGYTAGVPQFVADPVFRDLPTMNIDSGYGAAAGELGFIGLAVFVYLAFKVGIEGFRTWKRLPVGRMRDLLLGPGLIAATYPLVSVVFPPQAQLPSSIYFWLLIGMIMKAPALLKAPDADQLSRTPVHP